MKLLIVTGMSGAGKSKVVDFLEDLGYYCVDNVPPKLLARFAELSGQSNGKITSIALVVDVRSRDMFSDYHEELDNLKNLGYDCKTLFLDCSDEVLMRRYKETRRRHPLLSETITSTDEAIKEERALVKFARESADYLVTTSDANIAQLKDIITELFSDKNRDSMAISCISFGFKHGLPPDSDLVFDVRCLPNPFYVPELREQTGLDKDVRDYVLGFVQAGELIPRLFSLIDYLVPLYIKEGKSRVVIAFGCTGGKHRSVVFAELMAEHLRGLGFSPACYHRHMNLAN